MAAVELGTGYVSLIPSARGFGKQLSKELGGPEFADAGADAGERASGGFGSKFAAGVGVAAAAGGLAIAAGVFKAYNTALDRRDISGKLAEQLALSPAQIDGASDIAGSLYAAGFGESFAEVLDVTAALSSIGIDDKAIARQVAGISETFEVPGADLVFAGSAAIDRGLFEDLEQFNDAIAQAAAGSNVALEEQLELLGEYSPAFDQLGIEGPAALGLIGSAATSIEADKFGDALKELTINALDVGRAGPAIKSLGLNVEDTLAAINAGGPEANEALRQVAAGLQDIEDPAERSAAAVALFGTPIEDLGQLGTDKLLSGLADGFVLNANAAEEAAAAAANQGDVLQLLGRLGENALARLGEAIAPFVERNLPALEAGIETAIEFLATNLPEAINIAKGVFRTIVPIVSNFVGALRTGINFIRDNEPVLYGLAAGLGVVAAAFIVQKIQAIQAAIANFNFAGSMLAAILPVALLAAGIALLVAGVIWAYQNVDFFRTAVDAVWAFLKNKLFPIVKRVAGYIAANFVPAVRRIAGWFVTLGKAAVTLAGKIGAQFGKVGGFFTGLKNRASDVIDDIKGFFGGLVDRVTDLPGDIRSAAKGLFNALKDEALSAFNSIARLWNSSVGSIGFTVPGWVPGVGGRSFSVPDVPILHNGGVVPGNGSQEVLAILQAGEGVIDNDTMRNGLGNSGGGINFYGDVQVATFDEIERAARRRAKVAAFA